MPTEPQIGEVWFADLGMVEKNRPVLVLAYPQPADARSPHKFVACVAKSRSASRAGLQRFRR